VTNKNKKWSLLGKAGQKLPQMARFICRERLNSLPREILNENIYDTEHQLYALRDDLESLGLKFDFIEEDITALDSLDNDRIIDIVMSNYRDEYDLLSCPFEDDPSKRSCWGCSVGSQSTQDIRSNALYGKD